MKYFKNLKTSDKISLSFSVFSFMMLLVLLITINITYFFIWYNDQKNQSFYDMEQNYSQSYMPTDEKSAENFKSFLLKSDTLIIPSQWDPVCSPGILLKLHDNLDEVHNKMFYRIDETLYFIYSREYEGIGQVKVFFDTTEYISTQVIILKMSFVIIIFSLFFTFFIWKFISKRLLKNLTTISDRLQWVDVDSHIEIIETQWPKDDEIRILSDTLNKSFAKIQTQTQNLKQFITDVSHEFKTPLMSINSKIDLIQKKLESWKIETQEYISFCEYVKHQTKRLNTLLETLFLLSRFEENIQKFSTNNINFSKYLSQKTRVFFDDYPQINIVTYINKDIHLDIEDTTMNIIIENLFTNAVKFADKVSPEIEIWCDDTAFWVCDNGKWMTQEELSQVTQKFYKWDRNKEWFGIWLFLVQRIVKIYRFELAFLQNKKWGVTAKVIFK